MEKVERESERPIRIFIAGDSTAATYSEEAAPMAGWGQFLGSFFSDVYVINKAMCGRSSNSFIEEGRLEEILHAILPGDFLFIQFGHNDQKDFGTKPFTTYPFYLEQYINGAREKGAFPVLLTSVQRRSFDEGGRIVNTLGDYPASMTDLAGKLDVPLIDLWSETKVLYESFGPESSKQLFVWLNPGEHPNYPDGVQDNTHFSQFGAKKVAMLVQRHIRDKALF
ncbi:rhamnogalacturonan acetylesterase [Mesobacillus foraminis]|uniref:rhamnogalacturonan acetylesterase n=1 Tax=Mesobacillus foraminis TaxID=279826 RepID=UPI0039A26146